MSAHEDQDRLHLLVGTLHSQLVRTTLPAPLASRQSEVSSIKPINSLKVTDALGEADIDDPWKREAFSATINKQLTLLPISFS